MRRALTHKSHGATHNERLEFLGDAVLGLVVSDLLYAQLPEASEGELSRTRTHLVREDCLYQLALQLQLAEHVRVNAELARDGIAQRSAVLADVVEALLGAIYLDGGFEAAAAVTRRLFAPLIAGADAERFAKDAKTSLQEWLQGRRQPLPEYRIVSTHGKAHAQTFVVEASVSALALRASGEARSRRAAEQLAAAALLAQLQHPQDKP